MSVIIKGMDMPDNCRECPLRVMGNDECIITKKTYNWGLNDRPKDCPLEEAPDIAIVVAKQTGYPTIVVHRNPEDAYREDFGKESDNE